MILAIDPGETTGYFEFTDDGKDTANFGQLKGEDALIDYLSTLDRPSLIIVESFNLFQHKAIQQSGSDMKTSQIIGMIKLYAAQKNVPVAFQKAQILPIAEKFSGVKVDGRGGHAQSHWKSAYNHGVYYLVQQGIRKTKLQEQGGKV